MSTLDQLFDHEIETAAAQGWVLCDVYDINRRKVRRQILPLVFAAPHNNSEKATRWVIQRAQGGDTLALRAIRILMKEHKR